MKTCFPSLINSGMMMTFDACPIRGFREYIQHLSRGESTDLIAGGALAKGLEVTRNCFYNKNFSVMESIDLGLEALSIAYGNHRPIKEHKSLNRILYTLEQYFLTYPLGQSPTEPYKLPSGKFAIEVPFLHKLPFKNPDFPDKDLYFIGRLDMLANLEEKVFCVDEKTTGYAFSKNWHTQWYTTGQFTAYCWGIRKMGIPIKGAYVRGIYLGKKQIKFQDTIVLKKDWQLDQWEEQMLLKLERIIELYERWKNAPKNTPPNRFFTGSWNENCYSYFRPCQFQKVCTTKNSERYLEFDYDQKIWLPNTRQRVDLDTYTQNIENYV